MFSLPWHNEQVPVTWEKSDLRTWLNSEFLNTAFTSKERMAIRNVIRDNSDDFKNGTTVGANTIDKVILLNGAEWKRYFETGKPSRVMPTAYALKQGVYANETGTVAWWFRSPGTQETSPAYLNSWGDLGSRNHQVNETIIGVRPVMWVDKAVLKKQLK